MLIRFKPKFWKDINNVKDDREVMYALYKIFNNVEKANTIDRINNITKLEQFDARYRIKLHVDKKRDFRIGLYIHKKTVWFARFLRRSKVYDENW